MKICGLSYNLLETTDFSDQTFQRHFVFKSLKFCYKRKCIPMQEHNTLLEHESLAFLQELHVFKLRGTFTFQEKDHTEISRTKFLQRALLVFLTTFLQFGVYIKDIYLFIFK